MTQQRQRPPTKHRATRPAIGFVFSAHPNGSRAWVRFFKSPREPPSLPRLTHIRETQIAASSPQSQPVFGFVFSPQPRGKNSPRHTPKTMNI